MIQRKSPEIPLLGPKVCYSTGKERKSGGNTYVHAVALGKLASLFRPVIARYQDLGEEDRYTARDYIRKFNGA